MMGDLIGSQQLLQNNVQQLQQSQVEQKVCVDDLARKISQLSTSVNEIKGNQGRLPSQVQINPRENANKITLRSGKELNESTNQKSRNCLSNKSGEGSDLHKLKSSEEIRDSDQKTGSPSCLAKQSTDPASELKKKIPKEIAKSGGPD